MSEIIQKLKSIIKTNNPVVFEIGSCEGEHTKEFLRIFDDIQLFCFEPDPKNCADHRVLIKDDRCMLIEAAITDKDEDVVFHRSGGRPRRASGSIRKPKDHLKRHPWCTFDEDITVEGVTLDQWCQENSIHAIDLIWADVNGAETSMISGAKKTLANTRYLYTEFGPENAEVYEGSVTKSDIISLLPQFQEIFVNNNNVLLKNKEQD